MVLPIANMWFMSLARRKGHLNLSGGFVMQYYYKSGRLLMQSNINVTHRAKGTIPGVVPAQDIWVFAEDPSRDPDRLYMTIKNPSKPYRPAYLA